MKTKLLIATCAALLGIVVGWLIGRQPATKNDGTDTATIPPDKEQPQANVPVMPLPRKPDSEFQHLAASAKAIPLSDVYGTVRQRGLKGDPFRGDPEHA